MNGLGDVLLGLACGLFFLLVFGFVARVMWEALLMGWGVLG